MESGFFKNTDMDVVCSSFLFNGIDRQSVEDALSDPLCEKIRYKKGDVIYDETDFRRSLALILEGRVEVSKGNGPGRKYIMNTIAAPGLFGAAAIFSGEDTYVTKITATAPCRILFFPQELIEKLICSDCRISKNYIVFLSGRIQFLNKKIQSLVTTCTAQSVARYLVSAAEEHGGKYEVTKIRSYSSLAKMLNIGRASLYRSLDFFTESGLIERQGKTIVILDLNSLICISNDGGAE